VPIGTFWLVVLLTALSVGLSTVVVIVGFPILAATLLLVGWGANLERERATLVLGHPIARVPRPPRADRLLDRWRDRLRDRATWKDLGYMLLLGPLGFVTGTTAVAAWSAALAGLAAPAFSGAAPADSLLGEMSPLALAGAVVAGLALIAVSLVLTRLLARAVAGTARALLAPDERALLEARVTKLETTRSAAVESADARLRRIERDLHDGAQHRLNYIAMELDRARAKLADDPEAAETLLAGAHDESKRAMVELRDLVRGIHPSVLTDRGLDAATSGLAERCPVPVEVNVRLDGRPPVAAETAAYYVIAESLTNVGKHAQATGAAVEVYEQGGKLVVAVSDDGRGGARRAPGSGLHGLAQRVEALDGQLIIESPEGGPTTITAEIPCVS
jgi:signal transduction histidine kinase